MLLPIEYLQKAGNTFTVQPGTNIQLNLPAGILLTVNLFTLFYNEVQLHHSQKFWMQQVLI